MPEADRICEGKGQKSVDKKRLLVLTLQNIERFRRTLKGRQNFNRNHADQIFYCHRSKLRDNAYLNCDLTVSSEERTEVSGMLKRSKYQEIVEEVKSKE